MKRAIFFGAFLFFGIQLFSGLLIIYLSEFSYTKREISQIIQRIHEDVKFTDGKWNTVYYNSDPDLPGTSPVYILTTDGFVLERWKPLHGYLDISDFKHLLAYQTPQTITTVSNQQWRIYSVPIKDGNQIIGVVSLSYYNPQPELLRKIDEKLLANADKIQQKLRVKSNKIDTSLLDIRQIDYDIAFQIVNQFNIIISKNNNNNSIDRIPNFIDSSYVQAAINGPKESVVTDTVSGEKYLLVSSVIMDNKSHPLGVIVVGKSLGSFYGLLWKFFLLEGVIGMVSTISFGTIFSLFIFPRFNLEKRFPKKIQFLKNGLLIIDKQSVAIPYATNQYYMCKLLFSNPRKRFETDELLDGFGEEVSRKNARKVYDAMIHINKKATLYLIDKLVINKNKMYQINPLFIKQIV